MKKFILLALFLFVSQLVMAKDPQHALGVRLGGGNDFGTEISYQHDLQSPNRLEFDLGMYSGNHYNAWALAGLYQWVWTLDDGFKWYAGFGGRIGNWNYDHAYQGTKDSGLFLAAAGNIGIEYTFPIHLQLALDYRPEMGIVQRSDAFQNSVALSIRYRF